MLSKTLFNDIVVNENHKLVDLLPPRNSCHGLLRNNRIFNAPNGGTNWWGIYNSQQMKHN